MTMLEAPVEQAPLLGENETTTFLFWSYFVPYSFTVNFVLGVGVLSIPYAFRMGGMAISIFFILIATTTSLLTTRWQLESSTRAETHLLLPDEPCQCLSPHRSLEVGEMLGVFFGRKGSIIYSCIIVIYMWFGLCSYTVIFGTSMAERVPFHSHHCHSDVLAWDMECIHAYQWYIAMFAVWVIALTILELKEQKIIQVSFAIFRFVCLGTMLVTVWWESSKHPAFIDSNHQVERQKFTGIRFSGLATAATFILYAQLIQHGVPGLVSLVENKKYVFRVFVVGLSSTALLYILLGLTGSMYFGDDTLSVFSLHWVDYPWGGVVHRKWFQQTISWMIVLFPVLDVSSVYSLCAITMANNVFTSLPKEWIGAPLSLKWKGIRVCTRLLAAVPPILVALFVREFSVVLSGAGLLGMILMYIAPAMLQYKSSQWTIQHYGESATYYGGICGGTRWTWGVGIAAVVLMLLMFVKMLV